MEWDPVTHYKDVAIAERYDAERFSSLAGRFFNRLEKATLVRAFSAIPTSKTVVDVPCGTGRLAEPLLEKGYKVVGVDISGQMLDVARRRLARFGAAFETRVADVRELAKVSPGAFDAALCARVLMHFSLTDQIVFLRSVAELCRENVVLTHSLSTPYQRQRRRVKRMLGHQPSVNYPITQRELARLLAESGLRETHRLRTMSLVSEEIILVAQKAKTTRSSGT